MKKINKLFAMLAIALFGLSLTACDNGDDLSTDQYGNEITLNAFGPCPVLRGGTLHIYGNNIDQISEVDLPGADPITSFEVLKTGTPAEITIKVPAEKCDTGRIVIKTLKGGELVSVSPITYREDIVLDKFYVGEEGNLAGNVGQILTIKGDYLNLMHGVIFAGNDTIKEEQFASHDRYTISVAIPAEAKTGTIKLTNLEKEPTELESEEALTINLPEIEGTSAETIKAGNDLTIKGNSLDQITSIELQGATIEAADFKAQSANEITITIPNTASDGEINLITKSGVKVPAGKIVTVVPTDLKATPNPIKNGATITITGKDLDLVTGITFPNADGADAKLNVTAAKITAVVPEAAQEGDITLSLANGKTVTVAYTLVKPTVASCTPNAITAGERTIIKGTDLDLVQSITFPGDVEQTVSQFPAQTASAIAVTIPAACAGSGFKLNLKNGTVVEVKDGLTIKAATDPAIASVTPGEAVAGGTITITGKNFQNIQNIYIGSYKVNRYTSRSNTEIICQVPTNAEVGTYKIIMEDPDGNKIEGIDFKVVPAEKDIADFAKNEAGTAITYPFIFSWGDGTGKIRLYKADLIKLGVKKGSKFIVYKDASVTGQVQINDANWSSIYTIADWNGTETQLVQEFDDNMMNAINNVADGWSDTAFILQGDLGKANKIVILP